MAEIEVVEILELLDSSSASELSAEEKADLLSFVSTPVLETLPKLGIEEQKVDLTTEGVEANDIRIQLAAMGLPGRIKLALFGNSICRAVLIRDSNKMVQQCVMKNPKLSLKEVEEFSRNQHLSEFVLRSIADSKTWMKSALVKYNLVTNAKTPQDIALKWLRYLQAHEVRKIAKSKNIPQLVANTAKKLAVDLG